MVERRPGLTLLSHLILIVGVAIVAFPLYLTLIASTQSPEQIAQSIPMSLLPGNHFLETYKMALFGGETSAGSKISGAAPMMWVSLVTALIIPFGKITMSMLSAFAIVYFRFPFRNTVFWLIFVTLMLPVEVRIGPTYEVVVQLGMLNTYAGLTIPLIASATATFLFRQFFLTVPDELVEAARIDGASGWQISMRIKLPNVRSAALLSMLLSIVGTIQLFNEPQIMQTADPGISKTYTPMMMAMNTSQGTLTPGGDGPASAVAIVMALIAGVLAMIYALVERKANEQ